MRWKLFALFAAYSMFMNYYEFDDVDCSAYLNAMEFDVRAIIGTALPSVAVTKATANLFSGY